MIIRDIEQKDKEDYLRLVKQFYNTNAVMQPIPQENMEKAFAEAVEGKDRYITIWLFETEGYCYGYALLSRMYSQEAGGMTIWVDELFVEEEYRNKGTGHSFFEKLYKDYPMVRYRLEVEDYNKGAIDLYRKYGFDFMPYMAMHKENK